MSLFGRFIVHITCRLHVHERWRKATGYSEIKTEYINGVNVMDGYNDRNTFATLLTGLH